MCMGNLPKSTVPLLHPGITCPAFVSLKHSHVQTNRDAELHMTRFSTSTERIGDFSLDLSVKSKIPSWMQDTSEQEAVACAILRFDIK